MVYISEMVYDRNKLPMEHMFSVKLSKGVKSISEVTMTLEKKENLIFARNKGGLWKMCSLSITLFER